MRDRSTSLRWLERVLVAVGVVSLGYYGYMTAEARQFQREQVAAFESLLAPAPAAPGSPAAPAPATPAAPVPPATPIALLDIPRLKLSAPVLSGEDAATLDLAVGHLTDTPLPWQKGNSALAAHRDGLFRPLRNIRVGDEVRVRSEHGEFTYRVRETRVVRPDDLSVLAPTDNHTLTLITCYPFNFVGNAPKRFIVHADRLSADSQ
jgi:sortase A